MRDSNSLQDNGLEIGDVFFRRFQIQQIRKGGMGIIFIARDLAKDPSNPQQRLLEIFGDFHTCAVKTFQDRFLNRPNVIEQFVREAIAWVKLPRHEHVVFAHYVNIIDGRPYLFLEYVEGMNVRARIENSTLTPAQGLALALQICEGMVHIHEVGNILHRDLKPENLLIDNEGSLKITDLGLARALVVSDVEGGRQPGTLPYMAPEQFHGESSIQSDIYSFGVVLFEMLTGQRPSLGDHAVSKDPRQLNAALPSQVSEIVMNCLAEKPSQRYCSFAVIKEHLSTVIAEFFPETVAPEKKPADMFDLLLIGERHWLQADRDQGPSTYARYLIGHSLGCLGKYEEALDYFQPLMGRNDAVTEVGKAWIAAGLCLNALGRYGEALQALTEALDMRVWSDNQRSSLIDAKWNQKGRTLPFVWAALAYSWLNLEDRGAAVECLTQAVNCDWSAEAWPTMFHPLTDSPEYETSINLKTDLNLFVLWRQVKGNLLRALGRAAEAIRCFQNVLDIHPEHIGTLRLQANALLEAGQSSQALDCWKLVTNSETASWKDWWDRGRVHGVLEEYTQAVDCFDRALDGNEGEWRLWIEKGKALSFLNSLEEATTCMENAVRLAPKEPDAWVARGGLWLVQRCFDNAVSCYDHALALDSKHAAATDQRALALESIAGLAFESLLPKAIRLETSGRLEEALDEMDKLLQLSPKRGTFWAMKASMLNNLERHEEALAATNEALRYDLRDPVIHHIRGNVFHKMENYQAALKSFDRALSLDRTISGVWNDKGYLLKKLNQYAEAMHCYQQAVAYDPKNWMAWGNMGSLLGMYGEHSEALECFDKALALNPDCVPARLNRDRALRLLSNVKHNL